MDERWEAAPHRQSRDRYAFVTFPREKFPRRRRDASGQFPGRFDSKRFVPDVALDLQGLLRARCMARSAARARRSVGMQLTRAKAARWFYDDVAPSACAEVNIPCCGIRESLRRLGLPAVTNPVASASREHLFDVPSDPARLSSFIRLPEVKEKSFPQAHVVGILQRRASDDCRPGRRRQDAATSCRATQSTSLIERQF